MRATDLRNYVLVRKWQDVPVAGRGITQQFDTGVNHWAKKEAVGTAAFWGTKQTGEAVTHRFWFRYSETTKPGTITAQHVIELDNRRYRVVREGEADDRHEFVKVEVKDLGEIS